MEVFQPAIYTGLQDKTYTLFFNERVFEPEVVEQVISVLLDVENSGSYSKVEIYLKSVGGCADSLMMIADFLNNYSLDITFKVHGEISSCASLIGLMVKKAEMEFLPTARAMFHLGWSRTATSVHYKYQPNLDGASSDLEGLLDLNDYLWENFYSKLPLEEEEIENIKSGRDVFINRDRIEYVYETFKDRQFYEEDFDDCIEAIECSIDELKGEIERLEECKTNLFIDMEKFSDEHGLFDYDETEEDDFKLGGTE